MIKSYNIFLEKVLLPSQFRPYVKAFVRDRYADLFKKYKEKYDGDRNAYRIFLPLYGSKSSSLIETEIKDFLLTKDYEILDYLKGWCKHKTAKNKSKIGQILTRNDREDLLKRFNEDPARKVGENKMVCISRHPYDIAGADTDRRWTNCMTIGTKFSPRMKKDIEEIRKLEIDILTKQIEQKKVQYQLEDISNKNEQDEELQKKSEALNHEIYEISNKVGTLANSIANRQKTGCNVKYLISDVKEGSLISFLISKDDRNIKDPFAVMNIKPYINLDEEGETHKDKFVLMSDKNWYGEGSIEFKSTVDDWLNEVNSEFLGDKNLGIFKLNSSIYNDSNYGWILKTKNPTLEEVNNFYNKIAGNILNRGDILSLLARNPNINDDVKKAFLDNQFLNNGSLDSENYMRYMIYSGLKIDIDKFSGSYKINCIKYAYLRKFGCLFDFLKILDFKLSYSSGFCVRIEGNYINEMNHIDWFDRELHEKKMITFESEETKQYFKEQLKSKGMKV
jgi:hypothetical protein